MARAKGAKAPKDRLDRELAQLAQLARGVPTRTPLDPATADERLAAAWAADLGALEAGLATASPEGRELFARARAYVEAGMPRERRDVEEQAAFFAITGNGHGERPSWDDYLDRWVDAGGLGYAIEVALRASTMRKRIAPNEPLALEVLGPEAPDLYGLWLIAALAPRVAALDPSDRAALRGDAARLAANATPAGAAWVAHLVGDPALAKDAVARAEAMELGYQDPWPIQLFEVIDDAETFAQLLGRGAAAFQFFGPGYVLRARGRVSDAGLADGLVRFFSAGFAEPRRMIGTYPAKLAAVACAIPHPHLAWLFAEHGAHKWLKKHAPLYAARHPEVRPERPSERSLAARMAPAARRPRPAGFQKPELAALAPDALEARLLHVLSPENTDLTTAGHFGAALVLAILRDHPIPSVAAALHAKITARDFATQMPKPGFHKELQADLAALAKQHPAMSAALAAAKKAGRRAR